MGQKVTQAGFARMCNVSRKSVTIWKDRGLVVMDGKLVDVDSSYQGERNMRPAEPGESKTPADGRRRPRVDSKETAAPRVPSASADSAKNVREPPSEETVAGVPTVASAESSRLKNAVAHKEDFAGRLKELEYRQKAGELVEIDLARQVIFDESRAARDAWLNWPVKSAALMAADLGIEADRLAEVLTTYVHKQLASLGQPSGQFRKG